MIHLSHLPAALEAFLKFSQAPGPLLAALLSIIGELLQVERCFLYLRNPHSAIGKIAFCWCRHPSIPDVTEPAWKTDTFIAREDPLFAAALRTEPSIFVEDVETADPAVVNRDFEARTFGHRALIHAHIVQDRQLWGILQPCVFGQPRHWSKSDRQLVEAVVPRLLPLVQQYVAERQI
jgi:GAF domain-containing protein